MNTDTQQIDLDNPEFQNVWKLVQYTRQSVFLTGKAGTGKSTFLKYICANTRKRYVVLAPTGIAAVNVGGVTMHSFFRIPFKPLLPDDPEFAVSRLRSRLKYPKNLVKLIRNLDLIIIDEISMVRADIIDFMDKVLRVYSGNMREPFGGKQLLLVGDIFQLEPVVTADMRDFLRKYYPNSYFFSARAFGEVNIVAVELKKVYRQSDDSFIGILDRVRENQVTDRDLGCLNDRVAMSDDNQSDRIVMTLATTRDKVDFINEKRLGDLDTPEVSYVGSVSGEFPANSLPTAMELVLKVGAQVVFIKNDPDRRWVNGTLGKVTCARRNVIEVELENGDLHVVDPVIWENVKYEYDEKSKKVIEKVIGAFKQYPLRLAWALTVHKSQGLTFGNVVIDMGRGAFSAGQAYVALSRCRSLEGLSLRSPLSRRDIFVNPAVTEFSRGFNNQSYVNEALARAHADDCYHLASVAFDSGDVAGAFDKFIEGMRSRSELHNEAAMRLVRRKLGEIPRLVAERDELRGRVAEDKEKFRRLAREYLMMGNECVHDGSEITPALANYDKALSISPDYTDALYAKGLALMSVGADDDAMDCFVKLLEIDKAHFNALFQCGNICYRNDDLVKALDWYLRAADMNGKSPEVHNRLADVYEKAGEENAAEHHRRLAAKLKKTRRK
ncbi:MAG: AAA family ATPase [Pseudoflavonifractor sp.]|nr:AAA family ATPase [Pseudoflavonifractor sp.]